MDWFLGLFLGDLISGFWDLNQEVLRSDSKLSRDLRLVEQKALEKIGDSIQTKVWMRAPLINGLSPWRLCMYERGEEVLAILEEGGTNA